VTINEEFVEQKQGFPIQLRPDLIETINAIGYRVIPAVDLEKLKNLKSRVKLEKELLEKTATYRKLSDEEEAILLELATILGEEDGTT
jgi:hypothetical protein